MTKTIDPKEFTKQAFKRVKIGGGGGDYLAKVLKRYWIHTGKIKEDLTEVNNTAIINEAEDLFQSKSYKDD